MVVEGRQRNMGDIVEPVIVLGTDMATGSGTEAVIVVGRGLELEIVACTGVVIVAGTGIAVGTGVVVGIEVLAGPMEQHNYCRLPVLDLKDKFGNCKEDSECWSKKQVPDVSSD